MARNGDKKRTHELEERRRRVFAAWCQGTPQHAIADQEQVHPGQITRDLDAMLKRLHGRNLDDAERNRWELLGKIAHAEAELLAAWERSKKPRERKRAKTADGRSGTGQRTEREAVTEGRDGNPKFLAELRALWELKGRLLGLVQGKLDLTTGGKPVPFTFIEVGGGDEDGQAAG